MAETPSTESPIRRVVVLGHSGFIGSHLMRKLGGRAVGRSDPDTDLTRPEHAASLGGLIGRDTALVVLSAIKRQFGDTLDVFATNMRIAGNLCAELEKSPAGRVLLFSSAAVYGEDVHNTEITEDSPIHATSFYGAAKYAVERMFAIICSRGDIPLVTLRPPLIYGPGDRGSSYGPAGFIQAALKREKITLWGDGTELRDLVFIDDAVEIVDELVSRPEAPEGTFNLATGRSRSFKDILDIVADLTGRKLDLGTRPRSKAKVDNAFKTDRLAGLLPGGFRFTPLEEGIRRTLEAERAAAPGGASS